MNTLETQKAEQGEDAKLVDILSGQGATDSLPNAALYSLLHEDIELVEFLTGKLKVRNDLIAKLMKTHATGGCDPLPGVPRDESLAAFMSIEHLIQSGRAENDLLRELQQIEKFRFMVGCGDSLPS